MKYDARKAWAATREGARAPYRWLEGASRVRLPVLLEDGGKANAGREVIVDMSPEEARATAAQLIAAADAADRTGRG